MSFVREKPIEVVGSVIAIGFFLAVDPLVGLGVLFCFIMRWGLYIWLRSKRGEPLKFGEDAIIGWIPVLILCILVVVFFAITNH